MSNSMETAMELYQTELKTLGLEEENITQYEDSKYPMHPNLYFTLCGVSGFQNINGKDYPTYLKMWRTRHEAWKNAPEQLHN